MSEIASLNDIQCYNRGCQKKYNPSLNKLDACRHHPGTPVFHDALKGWSCCKKRSTDFTMFLNEPGCTFGYHSNEKQESLTERPGIKDEPKNEKKVEKVPEVVNKPIEKIPVELRPANDEQKIRLEVKVLDSASNAIISQLNILENMSLADNKDEEKVEVGTSCKRSGCKKQYSNEDTTGNCSHHPGSPVFHEGMKYWSCCQVKTSDFSRFLEQQGCAESSTHQWKKPAEVNIDELKPRIDWFQTGTHITISLFSKLIVPDNLAIETNKVQLSVRFKALLSNSVHKPAYVHTFDLCGNLWFNVYKDFAKQRWFTPYLSYVIDPLRSSVKLMASKVEINLRKSGPLTWKSLEAASS